MRYVTTRWLAGSVAVWLMSLMGVAHADHYRHLDEQALEIVRKSAALRGAVGRFHHTPHFRHLVEDADDLRRSALHVRQMVRRRADIRHIEEDVRDLDATFHHVQRLVRAIERDARHGIGHIPCDTRRVWELLNCIEHCIHQMQDDVAAIRRASGTCRPVRPVPPATRYPYYGTPSYRSFYGTPFGSPGGITFQRGGFRIRLNF